MNPLPAIMVVSLLLLACSSQPVEDVKAWQPHIAKPVMITEPVDSVYYLIGLDITSIDTWQYIDEHGYKANHVGEIIADSETGLIPGDCLVVEVISCSDPPRWIRLPGKFEVTDRSKDTDNKIVALFWDQETVNQATGACRVERITGVEWR